MYIIGSVYRVAHANLPVFALKYRQICMRDPVYHLNCPFFTYFSRVTVKSTTDTSGEGTPIRGKIVKNRHLMTKGK